MPRYFDKEDKNGVRITIDPNNILYGHKKLKKIFSPPISVGKKVRLIIKFEKLKNFNEQNMDFWHGKSILEKLPNGKAVNIDNIVFLENEQIFEKEIESEFTSCEGDLEYKVGSRLVTPVGFYRKDAFPLYTANVRSKEWEKYWQRMAFFIGIMMTIISGVILAIVLLTLGLR